MKKIVIIASRFAVYVVVAFGIWLLCLLAYFLIKQPETLTWYENFMTAIVGAFVSKELCSLAFQRSDTE